MKPKIYVSPSSQETNTGPGGYIEEVVMNLIADPLIPDLLRHGFDVMRNKRGNNYAGHVAESNLYKPDVHLGIHSNAMGANQTGKARGCEVLCYDPTNLSSVGTQLAQKMYARLSALTPTVDRGVKSGKTTVSEIADTHAPAVLAEIGFHDNPDDAKFILTHILEFEIAILLSVLDQFHIIYIPIISPAKQISLDLNGLVASQIRLCNDMSKIIARIV